ncbi:GAF domain-containing protein [Jiulongibacter sp. NS-SX5]|uniref:GAF domain-containing protein n=1 Tax=Jiulongibacter sp. NS-SX5 TaxID=3463854 RepID=UPI004058810E
MAENLYFNKQASRESIYQEIYPQIKALISAEIDLIANMANMAAALKEAFDFFWVGFYLVKDGELVLGPFQGPIACTRIAFNRGVCGHCYTTGQTVLVPDVEAFPGHIACSSASKSEVVVPVFNTQKEIIAVLDVDSDTLDDFSETDARALEKLVALLS